MGVGVLESTNERVAHCPDHAGETRCLARNPAATAFRRCFFALEEGWRLLSNVEEFTNRLERSFVSRGALLARTARVDPPRFTVEERVNAKRARNTLIAIVDDDPWAGEGMNSFVVSLGYLGVTFVSAEEYLNSKLKERTRCLILDVHLGGMSGPELQARLLADGYCTPIIFVTAKFEEHVRDRVMGAGAFGYLIKPCDETTLLNCLEQAIRG